MKSNVLCIEEKSTYTKILESKPFLTLKEAEEHNRCQPQPEFLWSGIKLRSFGLIFGPSKSGKSIFAENLAMAMAMGSHEFFEHPLNGVPRKVLFVGLEEKISERLERNRSQISELPKFQRDLILENYLLQGISFPVRIFNDSHWEDLLHMIKASEAEVVFIDSITRMNPGKLENSDDAEKLLQRLRNITDQLGITLICIHHTPKIGNEPLTMDSIKGSAVFSQESDFAIGIRATAKKHRYLKNVIFRYSPDNDEKVLEFQIGQKLVLLPGDFVEENEILQRLDNRRDDIKRLEMIKFFKDHSKEIFKTKDLIALFREKFSIEERQTKTYLRDLVNSGKLMQPSKGLYTSVKVKNSNVIGRYDA